MTEETTLQALKRIAPGLQFTVDPDRGSIGAIIDDMVIEDPFLSECGRFSTIPDYYGIPIKVALIMVRHNMECPLSEFNS